MIKLEVNLEEFLRLGKLIEEKKDVYFYSKSGDDEVMVNLKFEEIRVYIKTESKIVLYCKKGKYRFRLPKPNPEE